MGQKGIGLTTFELIIGVTRFLFQLNKNSIPVKDGPIPFPKIVEIGHKLGNAPFFGFGVGTDLQDSNKHLLSFDQDGLSFMNRDYYINKTDGKPIDFENIECELKE